MNPFSTKGIQKKTWENNSTQVRCIETQECFESMKLAGEWAGVDGGNISKAAKHGTRAGGYRWERLS